MMSPRCITIIKTVILTTLLSTLALNVQASSYRQSKNINNGESGAWFWHITDNYAASATKEKRFSISANHLSFACGDGLQGCNYGLMRRNTPCPVTIEPSDQDSLVFIFSTDRFVIDAACIDSTDNASIVLLPTEDNAGFKAFNKLIHKETVVTVLYNLGNRTVSTSEFSLIGSSKAIRETETGYYDGLANRIHADREQ
jgi:hypothetical protein